MENTDLRAIIGTPPEGSHPDEQHPRAATWHQERQNWIIETKRLRDRCYELEQVVAFLGKLDDGENDLLLAAKQVVDCVKADPEPIRDYAAILALEVAIAKIEGPAAAHEGEKE